MFGRISPGWSGCRDLCRTLLAQIPGVVLPGRGDAPHIVTVSVPGLRSQGIINCLQSPASRNAAPEGPEIYVSAGSACSKGHRSHVLEAMGLSRDVIDGAVRVSLCPDNTEAEIHALALALRESIAALKG